MKKIMFIFLALITLVTIAGCNGEREFAADGEYTAYAADVHSGPMVTTVTVTIEDDKIVGYSIDARQGKLVDGNFVWNDETKKELGFEYKMHYFSGYAPTDETPTIAEYETWLDENDKLEWHQQAALIEAYWLENGADSITTPVDTVIDTVSGVTIKNGGYTTLAEEAVQLAKDGKMQGIYCTNDDLYIATMTVDANGDFSELLIDVLQGAPDGETFAWKEKSKQELGYEYKMHYNAYSATDDTPTLDEYETWLGDNDKLEWFEQVALITDYVMENGWDETLTDADAPAGVTITAGSYYTLLANLFDHLED